MKIAFPQSFKAEYGGRAIGGSLRQAYLIRSMIDERGLPRKNFILARLEHMVSWNSETGEVKTVEYVS